MLLRSISKHVKDQNWFAVFLDFFIVVCGILIAFQITNWNDARADKQRAQDYLERIAADLDVDISYITDRIDFWDQVADYGTLGLDYAETGDAGEHTQWDLLLAYFQASQIAELVPSQVTYDELKSAGELGLVGDADFRSALSDYYKFSASKSVTERPLYREHVRGVIPLPIQHYIWDNCYTSDGSELQEMHSCASPVDQSRVAIIVETIAEDAALMAELRYWMSNMHVAGLIGNGRMARASALRASVSEELEQ